MLFQINDYTKLDIWLSYYWCPQAALANNITSFSVANKDPNVEFIWKTEMKNRVEIITCSIVPTEKNLKM